MKAIYTILILLSFSLISQAQLNGDYLVKTVPAPSLSNYLFEELTTKEIGIYLPPSYYESKYSFPVVYILEGGYCHDASNGYVYVLGYDDLIYQNNLEEMIVVIIDGCNKFNGSWYVNSSTTGNWEDFLRYDLVNYIDSHYRTLRKNQCRGIVGYSMGGLGAINLAMRNPDIFNSLYAVSPGIRRSNSLDYCLEFQEESDIMDFLNYLESLKADDVESELTNLSNTYPNQSALFKKWITHGTAFSPEPEGHVPFMGFPFSLDDNQDLIRNDSIANIWDAGNGQWDQKTELYSDNFSSLDTILLEYGLNDLTCIVDGVPFFHNVLNLHSIENTLLTHPGGHMDRPGFQLNMFPAMSITLWRDSSRFRTEADILSFRIDNQVREANIDSENYTVEAFVSDTSNIEAIRSHITLSDGAWESPMASQSLDFSWGPITLRVTSGDGQNIKFWIVTVTQVSSSKIDKIALDGLSSFPNPTSGIINITGLTEPAEVKIYSIQGQLMKTLYRVEDIVDVSDLSPGLYILNLKSDEKIIVKKIIIDR